MEFKGKGGGSANRVLLVGNLGADPETAYTQSGLAVGNFRIASNERYKDGDGNSQTRTEWHKCVAFGKLAEFCGEYLKKGSEVYIEGHLQTRKWQDKEGNDHYSTEVVVSELKALGGGKGSSDQAPVPEPPLGDDVPF
ncbi:MAG: single-stranded DNA-binding protein [Deltaproteobacteria bacterium RIFOXYC2_FULL_48_10]|nr:MAG: single-stranded DNA-binding protein [Deltaproteobacteria bacterium RIFOXYC2_FULL_48_10]